MNAPVLAFRVLLANDRPFHTTSNLCFVSKVRFFDLQTGAAECCGVLFRGGSRKQLSLTAQLAQASQRSNDWIRMTSLVLAPKLNSFLLSSFTKHDILG